MLQTPIHVWRLGIILSSDIDECEEEDQLCYANAECVNQPGSYRCSCRNGYIFDETTEICIGKIQ